MGQLIMDYLDQPKEAFGVKAVPTLRGLEQYLKEHWKMGGNTPSGLRFELSQEGLVFGFTGDIQVTVPELELDLQGALDEVGLALSGQMLVKADFGASLDFDFEVDWRNGLDLNFDLRSLKVHGSLSAQDVILNANLGPIGLSLGRPDDPILSLGSATLKAFGGARASYSLNPPAGGLASAVEFVKDPNASADAGVTFYGSAATELITSEYETATVRIWAPEAGRIVALKLGNSTDESVAVVASATTSAPGWQTLSFDFSRPMSGTKLNHAKTYNQASLIFEPGVLGSGQTYWFDDARFLSTVNGAPAQAWKRASLSAELDAALTFSDGQFKLEVPVERNHFDLVLPVYASLAGIDLTADAAKSPLVTISASPFAGTFSVEASNLDVLSNLGARFNIVDLVGALPKVLTYLESIDVSELGLASLPFIEQSVEDVLDLATVFKTSVVDRINFNRPIVPWQPAAGETALAEVTQEPGAALEVKRGTAVLKGASGQFAESMTGYWITVQGVDAQGVTRQVTTQIMGVTETGSRLNLVQNFVEDLSVVSYSVHQKIQPIQTLTEFAKALNDSGLLGNERVTFNAETGDLVLPVRFAGALADLQTPIRFALGEDSPISLSTTATGVLGIDVDAGFDLVLGLGGNEFELAIDRFKASADLRLAVQDLKVAAQLGFLTMEAGGAGSGSGVALAAGVAISLDRTPGNDTDGARFDIGQLLSPDALNSIHFDVTGQASASLKGLKVQAGRAGTTLDGELSVYVPELLDIQRVEMRTAPFDLAAAIRAGTLPDGAIVVVLPDVENLFDASNLSFADLVEGVRFGLQTLDGLVADAPFYTAQLPILNKSLSELIAVGDSWLAVLDGVMKDPAASLDQAEAALEKGLGLKSEQFDLSIDTGAGKLFLDLHLDAQFSDQLALNLELAELAALAGLDLPSDFANLVDASGRAALALAAGVDLQLRLGLTLPKKLGDSPSISIEDFDEATQTGTRLALSARLAATDINVGVKLGPLDLGVMAGSVVLDADGKAATETPARFALTWTEGVPVVTQTGAFDLTLPLAAKLLGRDIKIGQLVVATDPVLGDQGLRA